MQHIFFTGRKVFTCARFKSRYIYHLNFDIFIIYIIVLHVTAETNHLTEHDLHWTFSSQKFLHIDNLFLRPSLHPREVQNPFFPLSTDITLKKTLNLIASKNMCS